MLNSKDKKLKDGYSNIFYFPACVVSVLWYDSGWDVYTWNRGDRAWGEGDRVFSPATGRSESKPLALGNSDALPLFLQELKALIAKYEK